MPFALHRKPEPAEPRDLLADRALGAYLGLAVGDALGATVEFLTPNEISRQIGVHKEIVGGGWLRLKPGQVTDDTTMSLALGEAILASGGRVEALAAAQAFDAWMRAKPVDIGNTVRRNLVAFRRTGVPEAPPCQHDAGNGAIMRALPVALASLGQPAAQVAAAFRAQAHVTHHNALSDAGGETLVLMIQDALLGGTWTDLKQRARTLVEQFKDYTWESSKPRDNPSGYVVDTLQAVFQAFFNTDSFESCLIDVVNRGGDADTTGAIAGALAGAWYGSQAIPARWLRVLDKTAAGRCREQAERLLPDGLASSTANAAPATPAA